MDDLDEIARIGTRIDIMRLISNMDNMVDIMRSLWKERLYRNCFERELRDLRHQYRDEEEIIKNCYKYKRISKRLDMHNLIIEALETRNIEIKGEIL